MVGLNNVNAISLSGRASTSAAASSVSLVFSEEVIALQLYDGVLAANEKKPMCSASVAASAAKEQRELGHWARTFDGHSPHRLSMRVISGRMSESGTRPSQSQEVSGRHP
jgi:hypothetical protein